MFWGPLVDLSFTKRQWAIGMQVAITATLVAAAMVMKTPLYFPLTVAAMFLIATLSATHDIACDGLYLMSLDKKRQAAFSGVMAAFSRLGRVFVDGLLPVIAGLLITSNMSVRQKQWGWVVALGVAALVYGIGMI